MNLKLVHLVIHFIKTAQSTGILIFYTDGITNNGTTNGKITFTVPLDGPDTLYYNCQFHSSMTGAINLVQSEGVNLMILQLLQVVVEEDMVILLISI